MNKKLIKTIVSITCGLGIATTIPFAISSCSSNDTPTDKVEIKYNGTEESKNLDTIGLYESPQTASSSGTFSIIPEKPSSFSWSFNVFYNSDPQAGDYVIWDDWRTWIKLEINNLNQLQVTYISTSASSDIYAKVEVFGVTSDGLKTNTISGFNFRVFC